MVAIKIQSLEDIVQAYLQNLGFRGERLQKNVRLVSAMLKPGFDADDVLSSLDNLVYGFARKIFKERRWDKEQKIALFKLCFMECRGAERWGAEVFGNGEIPAETVREMRSKIIAAAPPYQLSPMLPQTIETPETQKLFGTLLHHKRA